MQTESVTSPYWTWAHLVPRSKSLKNVAKFSPTLMPGNLVGALSVATLNVAVFALLSIETRLTVATTVPKAGVLADGAGLLAGAVAEGLGAAAGATALALGEASGLSNGLKGSRPAVS